MKSEPEEFSIEDLRGRPGQIVPWDGVRNYQARNFMRDEMQPGDGVLFYHSNSKPPGIAGIAEIASAPYPDATAFDPKNKHYDEKSDPENPRWILVDVRYVETFSTLVTLDTIKDDTVLKDMRVAQRGNRLSITPVSKKEYERACKLGRK